MAESRRALPEVEGRLASDRRFTGLTAFVSTGCNVVVCGNVDSEKDEQDLRTLLSDIAFPHGIAFLVGVE
jgi:hypothetical protein